MDLQDSSNILIDTLHKINENAAGVKSLDHRQKRDCHEGECIYYSNRHGTREVDDDINYDWYKG